MASTSIFKCGFDLPCDGYACRNRAVWFLGEPRTQFVVAKFCGNCMKAIVEGWLEQQEQKEENGQQDEEEKQKRGKREKAGVAR